MDTCPNCGRSIPASAQVCPHCGFNLAKYRDEFFTDRHQKAKSEDKDEGARIVKRAAYRQEFYPKKQNTTMAAMILWLRQNATIAFLIGVLLLIITSFSVALGWIVFFILLIWLYIVCDRSKGRVKRYTADKRLTEKMNQVGSDVFNSVAVKEDKIKSKRADFAKEHPRAASHMESKRERRAGRLGYLDISAILTSLASLIVVFFGSGSEVSEAITNTGMSISHVLLSLASGLMGGNSTQALIIYSYWALLVFLPVFVIVNILRRKRRNKIWAFALSLIESLGLIYFFVHLFGSSGPSNGTSIFSRAANQILASATEVGTSLYFLLFASLLTTILTACLMFKKRS